MKPTTPATASERTEPSLDGQYGRIGIPAVAAALEYRSDAKNPAYAPVVHRESRWTGENAAA